MTVSRSIHISAKGTILFFFFITKLYYIIYMYHSFFIHSSVDGHLGCFRVLTIANSTSMNIGVHVPFWFIVSKPFLDSIAFKKP